MSEQPYKAGDKVGLYLCDSETEQFSWCDHFIYDKPFATGGGHYVINEYGGGVVSCHTLRHAPAPHSDYPGGADQYREDVATLTEAGALGDKATRGEWRWNFRHGTRYGDVATALESEASDGECFDIIELGGLPHMMVFSNADADLLVNAARVARALSRFMPWALARLGGAS